MRVYLLSTAVAPLGSGLGGGVESMIVAAARQLLALGHAVQVIAPVGSVANIPNLLTVPGGLTPTAVGRHYHDPMPVEADSFLVAALRLLAEQTRPGDVILNFSYDWLPLFLSDILPCPLGTLVSMGSLNRSLDQEIRYQFAQRPPRLAFLSRAQAASFGIEEPVRCIPPGLDLTQYHYNAQPGPDAGVDGTHRAGKRSGGRLHPGRSHRNRSHGIRRYARPGLLERADRALS